MELNSYGYDPWGFHTEVARRAMIVTSLIYRYYFRVETSGIENLPEGRILLIANHAGQIALDAAMIGAACLLEAEPPRVIRGMGEYWLPTLPFLNVAMVRTGSVVGTPKNCIDLLEHGEAVIAFPEGVRGMNKSFSERYRLKEFGNGFMRLALQTNTPIVPIAVVGSEEQAPSLGDFKPSRPSPRDAGVPARAAAVPAAGALSRHLRHADGISGQRQRRGLGHRGQGGAGQDPYSLDARARAAAVDGASSSDGAA
jgi:1-acyl-sn-glycerol-3-phosphate acyltransferase